MTKNLLPPTSKRVSRSTNKFINLRIREETISNINDQRNEENKISERINKLDYEWDIERILEANAASMILAGSISGFMKNKNRCFLFIGFVGFFLLLHSLQGWCPPVPILRRFGVRTEQEIQNEKFTLKLLRGDFQQISSSTGTRHILSMVEKQ